MPENVISLRPARGSAGKPRLVRSCSQRMRRRAIEIVLKFAVKLAAGKQPTLLSPSGDEISTLSRLVDHQARQFRISSRTVWRWYNRFLERGYAGLADQPRRDKGFRKIFRNRDTVLFVLGKHFAGCDAAVIQREIIQAWPHLSRDGSRPPSYATVRLLLKSMALPAARGNAAKVWP